jgi:hypothetical protein
MISSDSVKRRSERRNDFNGLHGGGPANTPPVPAAPSSVKPTPQTKLEPARK